MPDSSCVAKEIGKQKLAIDFVAVQQDGRVGYRMATHFAVVPVVLAAKLSLCSFAQLCWRKEVASFFYCAAQPPLGIAVSGIECPSEVFDFYKLPQQSGSSVVPSITK